MLYVGHRSQVDDSSVSKEFVIFYQSNVKTSRGIGVSSKEIKSLKKSKCLSPHANKDAVENGGEVAEFLDVGMTCHLTESSIRFL